MGDEAPSTGSQARQILGALSQYAPDTIKALSGTLGGTAEAQLGAEQAVSPGYDQLFHDQEMAAAQTEADIANGPGMESVAAADKAQQMVDPEFYKTRGTVSEALNKYLTTYSPTEMSPTEIAQISRGINATTGPVTESNLNTVKNAGTFGAAGTERWKNFGDAVTKAAAVLPTLKSGINGFQTATQRGTNKAANTAAQNALNANFGFSSTALNNITGAANAALAKKKDAWDQAMAGASAFQSVGQGIGGMVGGGMGCDVNIKENFANVLVADILNRVSELPVYTWNYIGEGNIRHIGPTAQDFFKVFHGASDKQIQVIDAIGVLLASVKELTNRIKILENKA